MTFVVFSAVFVGDIVKQTGQYYYEILIINAAATVASAAAQRCRGDNDVESPVQPGIFLSRVLQGRSWW